MAVQQPPSVVERPCKENRECREPHQEQSKTDWRRTSGTAWAGKRPFMPQRPQDSHNQRSAQSTKPTLQPGLS